MNNNLSKEMYNILNEAKAISATYPDKSYTMSKEVYNIAKQNNLKLEEGYALIGMAHACRAKSEINKMLHYAYTALEIFEALQEPLGQIKSLNLVGIAYFYNSIYEEALKYFLQALDLLEHLKDYFLSSCILNNIGEIFRESKNYERALEYYHRALKISTDINAKINIASLLNNIGEIYFIENKYEEALGYFTESYDILKEENEMVILGDVENKLGKVHYIKENYSKAEEYFFSALRRLKNIDNEFYSIDVMVNIAKLKWKKDFNETFSYLKKAIQFAEKTNARKKLSLVCKTVSEYYEEIGDFRRALEYFKKYHNVDEEIMTFTVANKFEIFKIQLEHLKENNKFEKTEMINKQLEMEILNQKSQLEKIQKLNQILEKKLFEDELTGIPNRRHINYHLNITLEEALVHNKSIALFIIDIDNFKKYNDYWGHVKGDECLIKIANCLKDVQAMRKDIFGRYGGEEFIYYAEGLEYDQALQLGNLIRNEVQKLSIKYTSDNMSNVVTISVGGVFGKLSSFKKISNLIQIADEELYKAKNMGKNIAFIKNSNEIFS